MTIDEQLAKLEKEYQGQISSVPGTQLVRCCLPEGGIGWSLALGDMSSPKIFFYGDSIESVLKQASIKTNYKLNLSYE